MPTLHPQKRPETFYRDDLKLFILAECPGMAGGGRQLDLPPERGKHGACAARDEQGSLTTPHHSQESLLGQNFLESARKHLV